MQPETTSIPETPSSLQVAPPEQMMQMITGYWVSQAIYAAAKLGIADQITDGPRSYEDLAAATGSQAQALYRLLRALASVGIFAETDPGWFTLTPLANYLKRDVPGSLRDVAIMMGDPEHYDSWAQVVHSVQTGQSGFEAIHGMNVFQFYGQNPEPAAVFDRAMTSFSNTEIAAVIAGFDFSAISTLVDVAGGHGSLLTAIVNAYPHMQGIVFDLPEVIERAKVTIAAESGGDRCQLIAGSFFESVPAGADAYILKHILHDWGDEQAIAILKQCHRAMAENGRVLIIEQVIPPGNDPFIGKFLDLNMLVMCPGGKERTAVEYEVLLAAAGFRLQRIVPTQSPVSVVEGVRAQG